MREAEEMSGGLRVIALGRTGLEGALRRDPEIELIRAQTPTDALGELACPIDETSPERAVVLVAPGLLNGGEQARFAAAARSIDAGVRVAGVGAASGFEMNVPADADAPAVRRELARHGAPAADAAPGERELVEAVLAGADVTSALVARAGAVLGRAATFGADEAPDAVEVAHHGERFGFLAAEGADRGALEAEAARMGVWLALARQHAGLRQAAFTDPLTGAWNRRYFETFLNRSIEHARGSRHDLTVLVFDIDDFKLYNDRFGHAAGDEILRETVRLMKSVVRPTDAVCRVGGDEFAVIFYEPQGPRTSGSRHPSSIADIAARFQKQISDHRFPKLGKDAQGTLTISGGMATFPWDGATPESLLERADQLAIESKRQGKNAITYGPGAERCCKGNGGCGPGPEGWR